MTLQQTLAATLGEKPADPRLSGIIKLAILAVGGQGGGVLTAWIEDVARSNGYAAQATSVAGGVATDGCDGLLCRDGTAPSGRSDAGVFADACAGGRRHHDRRRDDGSGAVDHSGLCDA